MQIANGAMESGKTRLIKDGIKTPKVGEWDRLIDLLRSIMKLAVHAVPYWCGV